MRRRVFPVTAAAALIASAALTGCTAATSAERCEAPLSSGSLSDSVRVSGDSADTLKVSLREGATALNAQRTVLPAAESSLSNAASTAGGDATAIVTEGSIFAANLAYLDSATGELLEVSAGFGSGKGDSLFLADPSMGTIVEGTLCVAAGETVAIALSAEESATMGVAGSLVVIAEITEVYGSRASGKGRSLPSGFPAVTTDETGRPGVVLPPQEAPAETRSAARIEGDGTTVTADHTVIGQVLTVDWGGSETKNTWTSGPVSFGSETDMAESGVTFRAELTGYPVGSQIVVIESGDTPRVSVIDILAVA